MRRTTKPKPAFKASASKAPAGAPPAQLQAERNAIAKNPADLKNIAALGAVQMRALRSLSTRMLAAQSSLTTAVNNMAEALQRQEKEISALDVKNLSGAGTGKLGDSYQPLIDSVIATEAQKKALHDIACERMQITQDLRHYIAAGPAIIEEYRSRYIPAASSPAEKATLEKRVEDLDLRLTVIGGSRAASLICGQQLKQMLWTMDDMIEQMKPVLSDVKDIYRRVKLDYEEKEAARLLTEAIDTLTQGTAVPLTVKKPLQFKPKP